MINGSGANFFNKPNNESNQEKVNLSDAFFYILLGIVAIYLIPYYDSIINVFWTAAKAETGQDVYYSMFALLIGIAVIISGFKMRNGIVKIFGLVLATLIMLYPMNSYFKNKSLFKKTLNEYDFVDLVVIKDMSCSSHSNIQKKITEQLIAQYGDDGFSLEVADQTLDENATYKEKLKCMASKTTLAYTLSYKDFYGESREIVYIDDESFNNLLKVSSYEIVYSKIAEFLKEHQGKRKVTYQLYLFKDKINLIQLNRTNLIEEGVLFEYPAYVSLANYGRDKRIILEIQMSDLSKKKEAHNLIDKLTAISDYPLNIIIKYGKSTEFFIQNKYYKIDTYQEYVELLSKKI